MIFFYMMITALTTASLTQGAVECKIKLGECTGTQQYFWKLTFHVPANLKTHLKKNNETILKVNNNTPVYSRNESNRLTQLNERFTLDIVTKTDSGYYQLETFNHNGHLLQRTNFSLQVQAPVSEPEVSQLCLSPDQMTVSCSTEGEGAEFIWSLDDNVLIQARAESTDKQLTFKDSNVTISLHGFTGSSTSSIRQPPSLTMTVTVAMIASVSTLLVLLALFLYIRHTHENPRPVTNEDNAENEIVYSDVRVKPARETRPKAK